MWGWTNKAFDCCNPLETIHPFNTREVRAMRAAYGSRCLGATMACLLWMFPAAIPSTHAATVTDGQEECYVMPYKADPPITVDGDLTDWDNVPNTIVLNKKEQVTYGAPTWTGPDDLSGTIHLSWRDGIYVAAEVTDDVVQQPYAGARLYQGDHVSLWFDLTPGADPKRDLFGDGQYQIAVNPGNFGGKAGGGEAIPPEVFIYVPEGLPLEGCKAVARRTDKGYVVEAYIPFSSFKVRTPPIGQYAAFEVALSDSDTAAGQETFITRGAKPWKADSRARLLPMVFGSGAGTAVLPARNVRLSETLNIPKGETKTVKFTLDAVNPALAPFLFFRGRVDYPHVAGYAGNALTVDLNGERIGGQRLSNRAMTATMQDNREETVATANGRIGLPNAPDFTSADQNTTGYALRGGVKAAEYEFYVGGLLKQGENILVFGNTVNHPTLSLSVSIGGLELRMKPLATGAKFVEGAPTGDLPLCEAQTAFPKVYSALKQGNGKISLVIGKDTYSLESRFSTPDGGWQTGSNKFFSHERKVIEHDEWIEVRDTFRNLTQDNLPIIQEHQCVFAKEAQGVWLAGIQKPFKTGRYADEYAAENGTVFATASESGVGMLPLNDEFMAHVEHSADKGKWVRIADPTFALKKGGEYTAEWAIVPVPKPDYYTFVNAARRLTDVNFPLKYMFQAVWMGETVYGMDDGQFKRFIDGKSINYLVQSSFYGTTADERALGTAWGTAWTPATPHKMLVDFADRIRRLYPDGSLKSGIFFSCFLDGAPDSPQRFASDRALDANGNHVAYGETGMALSWKSYVPTLTNGYGKEVAKNIDIILDKIHADGVYWDEFIHSKPVYVYNMWDDCSADIDPATHKLVRLKGSVPLLSRDFKAFQVKRILDRGAALVVNSEPITRTIRRLKFQAFVETGSGPANCMRTLLYSPTVLGDHMTEATPKDLYTNMLVALDHGCLYSYYSPTIRPDEKTLTEYMYPFTPIELHEGYVIGKERILTNRSGLFGWGDASGFTAHVYDRDGKQTAGGEVKKVQRDGKSYAEVRIPEGFSAAIVRTVK